MNQPPPAHKSHLWHTNPTLSSPTPCPLTACAPASFTVPLLNWGQPICAPPRSLMPPPQLSTES